MTWQEGIQNRTQEEAKEKSMAKCADVENKGWRGRGKTIVLKDKWKHDIDTDMLLQYLHQTLD